MTEPSTPDGRRRLIVGMSGASAPHYGIGLLRRLAQTGLVETHLVISAGALRTIALETDLRSSDVRSLADVTYRPNDMAAAIASGSFRTAGMVIAPCSMKTVAAIATGFSDNLIARAADVTLKERRPLVLLIRETPLSLIHLRNLTTVTEAGAVVLPPVPAFYHGPATIDDLIDHTVGKTLDQLGIPHDLYRRWSGPDRGGGGGPA